MEIPKAIDGLIMFKYGKVPYPYNDLPQILEQAAVETAELRIVMGYGQEEDYMILNSKGTNPRVSALKWYFQNIAHIEDVPTFAKTDPEEAVKKLERGDYSG